MDTKANRLTTIAREAFQIWAQDDEDGASYETGKDDVLLLEQTIGFLHDHLQAQGHDVSRLVDLGAHCARLRQTYRDFHGDTDGEATSNLFNAFTDYFGPVW